MAKCGWCMTGDHGGHLYGGDNWRCDCERCIRKGPDSPRILHTYVPSVDDGDDETPAKTRRVSVPTSSQDDAPMR